VAVAGVNSDSPAGNARWTERLRLPFPLLSDPQRVVAGALGGVRRLGIGDWTIDLTRRRTVLAGRDGVIEAVWDKVTIRGHAAEVLRAVRALGAE
jgi:peroxiredoxin Q/BCP